MRGTIPITTMFAALFILLGCAGLKDGGTRSASTEAWFEDLDTSWVYPPLQDEDLPPMRPNTPGFFIHPEEMMLEQYRPDDDDESQGSDAVMQNMVGRGYRVQILAGRDQALARLVLAEAREKFSHKVYLVFEAPQYKVRVGDFVNRLDADLFVMQAKAEGYKDAWVVKSMVDLTRDRERSDE